MARKALGQVLAPLASVKWALLALALLLAFNALFTPGFFAMEVRDGRLYGTLIDILNHGSGVAIVAIGMTLVIATGGVDLSVGAVVAVSGAMGATLVAGSGAPWYVAVIGALAVSLACGVWNGLLVVSLRLQPIVATLILMVAGRGIAQLITGGVIVTFEDPGLIAIGDGTLGGLPTPAWLLGAVFIACAVATRRTTLGLFIESVGDNARASRLSGVPDRAVKIAVYAFCGLCAGLTGLVECGYIHAADANSAGQLLELDAILAVVIGGTALTGGRFHLAGSIVGAMIMQTLTTTLYMQDVSADVAPAPKAVAVIVVCLLQSPVIRDRLGRIRGRGAR